MLKIKKVTAALLKKHKACSSEVERFNREFPGGADITLDNCHKAVTCDFNILWFASHCLPAPLWKAYEEGEAPLLKAYEEGKAQLLYRILRKGG